MPVFDVVKSLARGAFSSAPKTVDIGLSVEGIGALREQHSGLAVVSDRLASEKAIDDAINGLIKELEQLRPKAKALLETLHD